MASYRIPKGLMLYWGFVRVRFADLMANRTRFLVGIFAYLIYISVYYGIYRAVYSGGEMIGGLRLPEALTYVAVAWLLRSLYTNNLDRELTEEVRQGDIALSLLRPVDLPLAKLMGAAGEVGFRCLRPRWFYWCTRFCLPLVSGRDSDFSSARFWPSPFTLCSTYW
jgi:ABC-type uncharacterized transport system permease subunit